LQELAKSELNEELRYRNEQIEAFRDWIKKTPHLRARTDDQFLITFLRSCKFSLEKAKHKLDMFYTLRSHMPEVMQNRDPFEPNLKEIIDKG
jgi:hypothetical protein